MAALTNSPDAILSGHLVGRVLKTHLVAFAPASLLFFKRRRSSCWRCSKTHLIPFVSDHLVGGALKTHLVAFAPVSLLAAFTNSTPLLTTSSKNFVLVDDAAFWLFVALSSHCLFLINLNSEY